MQSFDVIVVGSGPAGSAAAITATTRGARTALIDKAQFPRDKLCGGLFTGRSAAYLKEIFGQALPDAMALETREIAFSFGGRPVGVMHDVPPMALTMRWSLDAYLQGLAIAAGAEDLSGHKVATYDLAARRLVLADGTALRYGVLIGADGVNSQVARTLFGAAFDREKIGFGLEIEAREDAPPNGPVAVDLAAARWGYGWSFPKQGATTIGVGGLLSENPDLKSAMRAYMEGQGVATHHSVKGHFLPWGDYRRVPGRDDVLLAGDAAGLVDPITGEGIALAMKSGQLAALAAVECLTAGAPDRALGRYRRALRPIHRSLWIANRIRPLIFGDMASGYFEKTFRASTTLKRDYMRMLAGEIEYGDILRAVLWRAPRIALGVLRTRWARKPS